MIRQKVKENSYTLLLPSVNTSGKYSKYQYDHYDIIQSYACGPPYFLTCINYNNNKALN